MPLPPLEDPKSPIERAIALSKALPVTGVLFSTLLGFNAAQTASLALLPFSPRAFRKFQRWGADTWWGWCVTGSKLFYGIDTVLTGHDVPMRENAIVVLNHQNMADIPFVMIFARTKDRLGDMKWMVKDVLKYVPGVGWGMLFLDCIFVKRDWAKDEASIRETFARLRENDVPVWLLAFSEGTRITPEKLVKNQQYARDMGLHEPRHVLNPRKKGFVATVEGLRDHVTAVYDVTVGYEEGVPTLWQYVKGYALRAHLHVRRYPIETLPEDPVALGAWIIDRFHEKDELLEGYYRDGHFPQEAYIVED